jgi:uncharacterized protein (DUF433 family)
MEKWEHVIVIDPDIRFGKPTIKGTRITVEDILTWLSSDMSFDDITEDFPELTKDSIKAALVFAAKREAMTRGLYAG